MASSRRDSDGLKLHGTALTARTLAQFSAATQSLAARGCFFLDQ
jgi:hypothetical protein